MVTYLHTTLHPNQINTVWVIRCLRTFRPWSWIDLWPWDDLNPQGQGHTLYHHTNYQFNPSNTFQETHGQNLVMLHKGKNQPQLTHWLTLTQLSVSNFVAWPVNGRVFMKHANPTHDYGKDGPMRRHNFITLERNLTQTHDFGSLRKLTSFSRLRMIPMFLRSFGKRGGTKTLIFFALLQENWEETFYVDYQRVISLQFHEVLSNVSAQALLYGRQNLSNYLQKIRLKTRKMGLLQFLCLFIASLPWLQQHNTMLYKT